MREGIRTSLISILCVVATSASFAAPAVRNIGGNGTYDSAASAASAGTASRAGSLRTTGGYVRPNTSVSSGSLSKATTSATTNTSNASGTTTGATAKAAGSVSSGGTAAGRVASTPRLSIGKYVGAPKSLSSASTVTSDLTARVEKLEGDVITLETEKQDALKDSEYITVSGDELILDVDKIKEKLKLKDGREVEMGTNDEGLLWRYVGDEEWNVLITWADLREKLGLGTIDDDIDAKIALLRAEMLRKLAEKVDVYQGTGENGELIGRALIVDENGNVAPTGDFASQLKMKVNIHQDDPGAISKALVVGTDGNVAPTGEFANAADVYTKVQVYNRQEVDEIIAALNREGITLDSKVDKYQGDVPNAIGMALIVNRDGYVEPSGDFVTPGELDDVIENYKLPQLGDLAYMNKVGTAQIESQAVNTARLANDAVTTEKVLNKSITQEKLADGLLDDLEHVRSWEQWWQDNKPGEGDYVMSVTADGERQWFRIVTAEENGD